MSDVALPTGWIDTTLGGVVAEPRPKAAPENHPELPFIGMDHIAADSMQLLGSVRFGDMKSKGGLFYTGDVLYGRMRPYLNKVHCAKFAGACSAEFIVFPKSEVIRSGFLTYLLHHRRFVNFASSQTSGDRPRVALDDLSGYRFLLPPWNEQSRIVSKIDELFSRVDEGERALKRVQKLAERYRQSVFKAAVTGELTREWRETRMGRLESGEALLQRILDTRRREWEEAELSKMKAKGIKPANDTWKKKYRELLVPDTTNLPNLPASWAWASVEQAGEVRLGRQRAPQHHFGTHMRPYLRVANVYEDRLELSDVKEMNFTPDEFKTYELRFGDILLNEGQSPEYVGRPAMYRSEITGCCYQKTLLRFRAHSGITPDFALLVFRSYLHCGRFRKSANITTSIAHLAAERFVVIEFPIPSEDEQKEIVEAVTRQMSRIEHFASELQMRRKTVEGLRQSILRAAFSGRLSQQHSTDESAAVLINNSNSNIERQLNEKSGHQDKAERVA